MASTTPALPDFMTNPDAVLKDDADWRHSRVPDYGRTREFYQKTKKMSHVPGSLENLVENLVKNWEIEASYKLQLKDWRTVDQGRYTFSMNGGPEHPASDMVARGTYNAIIAPNEYYCPFHNGFSESHKTFKRMMPTFAWEVLEVYSPPPRVAFKWRHWGEFKQNYTGFNERKVTAMAHGGLIDIQGVTVAEVDANFKVIKLETWFDPLDMFRQMAPSSELKKEVPGEEGHKL